MMKVIPEPRQRGRLSGAHMRGRGRRGEKGKTPLPHPAVVAAPRKNSLLLLPAHRWHSQFLDDNVE